jgi:hypothetical protein
VEGESADWINLAQNMDQWQDLVGDSETSGSVDVLIEPAIIGFSDFSKMQLLKQ